MVDSTPDLPTTEGRALARDRVARVFRYLLEMHRIQTPPIVHWRDYDWSLRLDRAPHHPAVDRGTADDGSVLTVGRAEELDPPRPSVVIEKWIKAGWDDPNEKPTVLKKRSVGKVEEAFEESDARVEAYAKWLEARERWAAGARGATDAQSLFSELFELSGQFAREAEKYQLYLADGFLTARIGGAEVCHPLLLRRIELTFDAAIPQFSLRDCHEPTQLYSPLLRHLGCDGRELLAVREALASVEPHPLERTKTTDFLKDLVQRFWEDGTYLEHPDLIEGAPGPAVYRQPTVLLGHRNHGFAESLEDCIAALEVSEGESDFSVPESLLRIVGCPSESTGECVTPVDPLLTKEANPEQERVIERLEHAGAVLVQGPPGTGKSHTIANLVGHLLAQNKTILVTSHASKALRVVRDKVATPLQSLCVSLLESDEEGQRQLEESITGIVNALSTENPAALREKSEELAEKRRELQNQEAELRRSLRAAIDDEERAVAVGETEIDPSTLAQDLAKRSATDNWIPGPLATAASPLTDDEWRELYTLRSEIEDDAAALSESTLIDPTALPTPEEFASLFDEVAQLETSAVTIGEQYWTRAGNAVEDSDTIARVRQELANVGPELEQDATWRLACLEAGKPGAEGREGWRSLVALLDAAQEECPALEEQVRREGARVPASITSADGIARCDEILDQLRAGEALGGTAPTISAEWEAFAAEVTVDGGTPRTIAHFQALRNAFELRERRDELRRHWDRQVGPHEGPSSGTLGERPELRGAEWAERLRAALEWWGTRWTPIERTLTELGFDAERFHRDSPPEPVPFGEIHAIRHWAASVLPEFLEHRLESLRFAARQGDRQSWQKSIESFVETQKFERGSPAAELFKLFLQGLKRRDFDAYSLAHRRLSEAIERRSSVARLRDLAARLAAAAPAFAEQFEAHRGDDQLSEPPGSPTAAWEYRQLRSALEERHSVDFQGIQNELAEVRAARQEATAEYVETLAWAAQLSRTGPAQQQALAGWLALHKKIGRGTGKGVPRLREEAQKVLAECRSAVPVWIMPLSRVIESFDLATTRFDVVILDEASQNDVTGLVALALGKEAVVVGDHEQVSPYAVGYDVDRIQSLIDEILTDIPNASLYDGRTSVYDLARQSFGGTIRLVEHFRCVPDIIQFSNLLCYGGEIRPLRERSASSFLPHVIAHPVEDGEAKDKVNRREAVEIASLIAALCEEPTYDGASIGVISMVGTEQALHIDSILRARLPLAEIERRRLLCGNASQFQGDERDVMFLSLVDSPKAKPLALRRRDEAKKVFNVAASRARDQLWVVHSLDPARDLKAGDLRLQLISHASDPGSSLDDATPTSGGGVITEFERSLHRDLEDAGYRATLHFPVGAMPIDLVVEGSEGQRVAILCEGGHPEGADLEARIDRPLILSRLGWTVLRIRSSVYFLDRKASLRRLTQRLKSAGIEPIGEERAARAESSELSERILDRAVKIRRKWSETGGGVPRRKSK